MLHRMLVAGLGNIFLGDDGFGVEVASRLAAGDIPDWVRVADFGVRSLHLAYELRERDYALVVLVDLVQRGGPPGTIYLIEPEPDSPDWHGRACGPDPHGMSPDGIFATLKMLGGAPGRVLIVGCEPESTAERIGLSAPVAQAAGEAVALVRKLIAREASRGTDRPAGFA